MESLKVRLETRPEFNIALRTKHAQNIALEVIAGEPYMVYDPTEECLPVFHRFYCIEDGNETPIGAWEIGEMVLLTNKKRYRFFYGGEDTRFLSNAKVLSTEE